MNFILNLKAWVSKVFGSNSIWNKIRINFLLLVCYESSNDLFLKIKHLNIGGPWFEFYLEPNLNYFVFVIDILVLEIFDVYLTDTKLLVICGTSMLNMENGPYI